MRLLRFQRSQPCLRGAAGMADLHAWSPLDFAGFGISCREHMYLDNGSASFEIAGFEKDQRLSSTPRNFSGKWNFCTTEKKMCMGYVFRMNIISYCRYSFTPLADPYRLINEWRLSQVILGFGVFLINLFLLKKTPLDCKINPHLSLIIHLI